MGRVLLKLIPCFLPAHIVGMITYLTTAITLNSQPGNRLTPYKEMAVQSRAVFDKHIFLQLLLIRFFWLTPERWRTIWEPEPIDENEGLLRNSRHQRVTDQVLHFSVLVEITSQLPRSEPPLRPKQA